MIDGIDMLECGDPFIALSWRVIVIFHLTTNDATTNDIFNDIDFYQIIQFTEIVAKEYNNESIINILDIRQIKIRIQLNHIKLLHYPITRSFHLLIVEKFKVDFKNTVHIVSRRAPTISG